MAAAVPILPVSPSQAISMEQYLRTSYQPDCDFVEGVLEERNLGEYSHAKLQTMIAAWLDRHELEWNINPLTEQRIRVTQDRVRIVDICALRADAPREAVILTPPVLCIEILSPEDRISRSKLVLEDYYRMGVAACWLVDPIYRVAYVFDAKGLRLLESTERLELPGTPVYLPLDELFARLD